MLTIYFVILPTSGYESPFRENMQRVAEMGVFGSFVGKLTLPFVDGKLVAYNYELINVDPKVFRSDPEIQFLINEAKKPYEENLEAVIG